MFERLFVVPGTSPSVKHGGSVFLSRITIGGIQDLEALTQAITVVCVLSPEEGATGLRYVTLLINTLDRLRRKRVPDLSMLKIWNLELFLTDQSISQSLSDL